MEDVAKAESTTGWIHVTGDPTSLTAGTSPTSDASQSKQTSPPAKRRKEDRERTRVSRACDRCKKKKTRCNGRYPCESCVKGNLSCEYKASYTRGRLPSITVDDVAIASIPVPASISTPAQTSTSDVSTLQDTTSPPFQFTGFQDTAISPGLGKASTLDTFTAPDNLEVTSEGLPSRSSPEPPQIDRQGHYIGPASGVSFLLRIQKTLHSNSSLSHDSSIFTFGDSPLPDHDPSFFLLPPKVDAERLISRYFDFAQPAHRFLHRPTMERILHEFYETQGEMRNRDDAPTKTALLFIVFAQAQAYMPPVTSSQDNSARYYFAAERQLSKERGAVRLASVQARLVQCFYLLTQSRINHAWSLFGTMAHLAFAIGLNRGRRADPTGTLDYLELESRRRLFWCAYTLDKYLSAALGRPRTFKDEDIDQELPTVIDDEDLHPMSMSTTPSNYPPIMMAPVEHIKLSRMISLILRDLYAIHPPSLNRRIELTAKYSQILQEWRTSPVLSNFLDSPPPAVIYQRQRNVLNLSYFHTILLIHRPFLLSNFASLARISNSQPQYPNLDTARHIRECLDAAMGIVETVDALFQTAQMFRSFWFTQYYAFCAVVVLYIYRIQQHIVEPGKCEGYFAAAQKCQAQLSSISETDCLSKRYCLVLEELRVEAARQIYRPAAPVNSIADTTPAAAAHSTTLATLTANDSVANLDLSAPKAGNDAGALFSGDGFYNGNVPPTPESDVFATGFLSNSSFLTDFSSWGQFDSLVTAGIAGIGVLDGSNGWQNDNMSGLFGFGR